MISFWTAIGATALLFVLAGLVRQRDGGGRCSGCSSGCSSGCAHHTKEEHDVTQ